MGKLVRDRIPEIIRNSGEQPQTRILTHDEYVAALLRKVTEEASELVEADPEDRLLEAADVYEVVLAVLALEGQGVDELVAVANQRRTERGGFRDRVWLD